MRELNSCSSLGGLDGTSLGGLDGTSLGGLDGTSLGGFDGIGDSDSDVVQFMFNKKFKVKFILIGQTKLE